MKFGFLWYFSEDGGHVESKLCLKLHLATFIQLVAN